MGTKQKIIFRRRFSGDNTENGYLYKKTKYAYITTNVSFLFPSILLCRNDIDSNRNCYKIGLDLINEYISDFEIQII